MEGTHDPRLGQLADVVQRQLDDGDQLGVSVCVVHDGEVVADLWGGWADPERTRPWERDTIVNVWSISKTMTNLCALVLADRGELDLDAPVADVWPEFAAHGKQGVLVRHVLGHTSGVPAWEQPVDVDVLYDWDDAVARLAAQPPWWEPGTASGYHMVNQGHLVGELVRRVTGESVGSFFAKEVAGPLGADLHVGLPATEDDRVATLVPPRMIPVDRPEPGGIPLRTLTGPFVHASEANSTRWRRAEVPAANAHGNARSVARVQSVVSHGGEVDGVRLLSEATVERIFEEQASGTDLVLEVPIRFGIGWALPEPASVPSVAPGRRCFWAGLGGAFVLNDVENRLTVACTMNRMAYEHAPALRHIRPAGDSRSDEHVRAVYAALALEGAL